jgi:ElaB/YqjD/DUF883 family membrane-anchored ribosome-binding protein
MNKSGIDQDALIKMFSEASAKQGEALRKAVGEATLKALQGRELTLDNIRKIVKSVTQATSTGAAQNPAGPVDVEAMLGKALAGMDSALLQAVEANRKALAQFVEHGAGLQEKPLKEAIANVEKMEDVFFATVKKATQSSGPLQAQWEQVLGALKVKGTDTGAQATAAVEELMNQAQSALRDGRATGLRAAQAMLDGYAALVSGVLIGMSEGLQRPARASSASSPASDASSRAESTASSSPAAEGKAKGRRR